MRISYRVTRSWGVEHYTLKSERLLGAEQYALKRAGVPEAGGGGLASGSAHLDRMSCALRGRTAVHEGQVEEPAFFAHLDHFSRVMSRCSPIFRAF